MICYTRHIHKGASIMTQKIFRVQGVYASGRYVSHLVGADNVNQAAASVLNADSRILRVTKILPASV